MYKTNLITFLNDSVLQVFMKTNQILNRICVSFLKKRKQSELKFKSILLHAFGTPLYAGQKLKLSNGE